MFRVFKRAKEQHLEEPATAENALETDMPEENEDQENKTLLETELSIPSGWHVTDEERYVYAFHNTQSPGMKVNQVSITGMELFKNNDGSIKVTGLIRSTVTKPIQFKETPILLLDENNEKIARKEFDLAKVGTIPPNSARPWNFTYDKQNVLTKGDLPTKWSLAFEIKPEHTLDLEPSWEDVMTKNMRERLQNIVETAPSLGPNEMNLLGINASFEDNGDLKVIVLFRNGSNEDVPFDKIPLGVKQANGEDIAQGVFTLENFTVKANTSKPWSFVFPKSLLIETDIDLSRWSVYIIQ